MALRSIAAPVARRTFLEAETCVFCFNRQFRRPIHHTVARNASFKAPRSARSLPGGRTPQQMRNEIDERNRIGLFTLLRGEGILPIDPPIAEKVIADFEAGVNVLQVAETHKVQLSDIVEVAHAILKIPLMTDKKSQGLPPSSHERIAKGLLLECSKAKEPTATLDILRAVYLGSSLYGAGKIANLFSPAEIRACRVELQRLALDNNADAMTLLGQFLEQSKSTKEAKRLYEKATELQDPKYEEGLRHLLPQLPPWNALGLLLLAENTPESLQQAKSAFEKGALQGDDPIAYYHLACLGQKHTTDWLLYMTKAAGSGHLEAMYALGDFYQEAGPGGKPEIRSAVTKVPGLARAMQWILGWAPERTKELSQDWFLTAASAGHKPSMMRVAEWSEARGDHKDAENWLAVCAGPPVVGKVEQWPSLVEDAKRRLQMLRIQAKPVVA